MGFSACAKAEVADGERGAEDCRCEAGEEGSDRLAAGETPQEGQREDRSCEAANDHAVLHQQDAGSRACWFGHVWILEEKARRGPIQGPGKRAEQHITKSPGGSEA
ncbi:hypothetical protein D3C79_679270 [compost metagenome]